MNLSSAAVSKSSQVRLSFDCIQRCGGLVLYIRIRNNDNLQIFCVGDQSPSLPLNDHQHGVRRRRKGCCCRGRSVCQDYSFNYYSSDYCKTSIRLGFLMDTIGDSQCSCGYSGRRSRLASKFSFPFEPSLTIVQRQNKLWGVHSNNTIVPEGGETCHRVSGFSPTFPC
jgi:hypothetical protein